MILILFGLEVAFDTVGLLVLDTLSSFGFQSCALPGFILLLSYFFTISFADFFSFVLLPGPSLLLFLPTFICQ